MDSSMMTIILVMFILLGVGVAIAIMFSIYAIYNTPGSAVISGTVSDPNTISEGKLGDFYINPDNVIYGPKTSTGWAVLNLHQSNMTDNIDNTDTIHNLVDKDFFPAYVFQNSVSESLSNETFENVVPVTGTGYYETFSSTITATGDLVKPSTTNITDTQIVSDVSDITDNNYKLTLPPGRKYYITGELDYSFGNCSPVVSDFSYKAMLISSNSAIVTSDNLTSDFSTNDFSANASFSDRFTGTMLIDATSETVDTELGFLVAFRKDSGTGSNTVDITLGTSKLTVQILE